MPSPLDILQQYWGHSIFRSPQEEVIKAVMGGRDTLAILPTGAGKSVCYQVPALIGEGTCLVVSPLIALMRDQVESLKDKGISAAAVYSGMTIREIDLVLENAAQGVYRLLYVSPERLKTKIFLARVLRMHVKLVAVDEAHCISQWGYDFRPSYHDIAELRNILPNIPFLALTASATPEVKIDILEKLQMKNAAVFQISFLRPNIGFAVLQEDAKAPKLFELVKKIKGTGIIYSRSRRQAEEVSSYLSAKGESISYYHAGLPATERTGRQIAWQQGNTRIISCTNAFGMGIDKQDVRFVIHADMPDAIEAYYQEAGRAGRDGKRAYAIGLYKNNDLVTLADDIGRQFPERETVVRIYLALMSYLGVAMYSGEDQSFPFDLQLFSRQFGWKASDVLIVMKILHQEGYLFLSDSIGSPSRLKFTVDKSGLYRYQLEHENLDAYIRFLLRSYGGIYDFYTPVREPMIASKMKVTESAVTKALIQLQKAKIIDYIPATDLPMVTLLVPRLPDDRLVFDTVSWVKLKKIKASRVQAMVDFVKNDSQCRQQAIAAYFGEKDAPECGLCDFCLDKERKKKLSVIRSQLLENVKSAGKLELSMVLSSVSGKKEKEALLEQIRILVDEKLLTFADKNVLTCP